MSTYRFTGKIGEGGMAEVFSAVQEGLERPVAIKVLKPWMAADPTLLQRFHQEAKTLAAMDHEGLVKVIDLGEQDNRPYLVMEMLQGQTLQERLRPRGDMPGAPLTEHETLIIAAHVLTALVYAHERHNVVHRDIKPGNVFLCDGTQGNKIKLMDFGIASLLDGPRMTRVGDQLGTPEYMCPEQIRGETPTAQWDIYGLGILMYEMATGDVPFNADTPIAVAHKHLHERVPQLPDTLSSKLRALIEKALAKEPAERFLSARDMLGALHTGVSEAPAAVAPKPPAPQPSPVVLMAPVVPDLPTPITPKPNSNAYLKIALGVAVGMLTLFVLLVIVGVGALVMAKATDTRSNATLTTIPSAPVTNPSAQPALPSVQAPPADQTLQQPNSTDDDTQAIEQKIRADAIE
jgi:serine/threonine protein kinase